MITPSKVKGQEIPKKFNQQIRNCLTVTVHPEVQKLNLSKANHFYKILISIEGM